MSDLFPTKTRLALMRAVAAGHVLQLPDEERGDLATFDTTDAEIGAPARRVNARAAELERAGWVRLMADDVTYRLTDAGRAVLDGAS